MLGTRHKARYGTAPCLAHGGPQRFLQRLAGTCPPGHPAVALPKASPLQGPPVSASLSAPLKRT